MRVFCVKHMQAQVNLLFLVRKLFILPFVYVVH